MDVGPCHLDSSDIYHRAWKGARNDGENVRRSRGRVVEGRKKGREEGRGGWRGGREAGKVDPHASRTRPMDTNRGGNAVASTLKKMAMAAMAEARRTSESTGSCTERNVCRSH